MDTLKPHSIKGQVRAFDVCQTLWTPSSPWGHNDVMYDWATIVSQLLTAAPSGYRISGMYFEFKNLASSGDTVTPPGFDRSGGIEYYNGLSTSSNVDYLRVPIIASPITSSDGTLFPAGNVATFFAQSQGVAGVFGKPFSSANNSKVYGGALVAIPSLADRTQDLVFSRFYLDTAAQQLKLANSQIGLAWELTLE